MGDYLIKKYNKKYQSLSKYEKKSIFYLTIIAVLAVIIAGSIYFSFKFSNNYILKTTCSDLITYTQNQCFESQQLPLWMQFYNLHKNGIDAIIFGIVLAWIINGVGFRIL